MGEIKRIISDYAAGELILQIRAAHAAIQAGRPADGLAVLTFEGRAEPQVFAVKFKRESVRVMLAPAEIRRERRLRRPSEYGVAGSDGLLSVFDER